MKVILFPDARNDEGGAIGTKFENLKFVAKIIVLLVGKVTMKSFDMKDHYAVYSPLRKNK